MLGLLHLCFLHDHNADNAARLYRLSRSGRQEFPLAVVSLNVTKWTMQVREEADGEGRRGRNEDHTGRLGVVAAVGLPHFDIRMFVTGAGRG